MPLFGIPIGCSNICLDLFSQWDLVPSARKYCVLPRVRDLSFNSHLRQGSIQMLWRPEKPLMAPNPNSPLIWGVLLGRWLCATRKSFEGYLNQMIFMKTHPGIINEGAIWSESPHQWCSEIFVGYMPSFLSLGNFAANTWANGYFAFISDILSADYSDWDCIHHQKSADLWCIEQAPLAKSKHQFFGPGHANNQTIITKSALIP